MNDARLAHITVALTPGIGRARFDALIDRFETPENILAAELSAVRAVKGMSTAAATAIVQADRDASERIVARVTALGGVPLLPDDAQYPRAYKTIPESPLVLFALGNLAHLTGPAIAIVGSRSHTRYGAEVCRHLAGAAAKAGVTVASGMARGLDAIAHAAALDVDGRTVGVLGNGFGVIYPSANRKLYERMEEHGCLITEFPPGERPNAGSFQRRNRLISGLAQCTLVVEAGARSGTLITVDQALLQGREVLVVPGPVTSPTSLGCNRLLQQGAKAVIGARDVLDEFHLTDADVCAKPPADLSDLERRILDALEMGAETVDDLADRLSVPACEVLAVLTGLEVRGLLVLESGGVIRQALLR